MVPFDISFALAILPQLLAASIVTIQATIASFVVSAILGLALALMRRSSIGPLRWTATGFVQFIRATPLLVQLYFLFFILPRYGVVLSPFVTGVIGLGLHYACYTAEVYRAGIEGVARGQWEAGLALGYSRAQIYRLIILPQAIPPMTPALGNYLVSMFKDTPMLAAITVVEMSQVARIISSETFNYIEPMTIVGLLMLVLSLIGATIVRRLDMWADSRMLSRL